jgi:hypothetical protein
MDSKTKNKYYDANRYREVILKKGKGKDNNISTKMTLNDRENCRCVESDNNIEKCSIIWQV